jgi:putative two-component system response regulator
MERRTNILVADDDPVNRSVAKEVLVREGYSVLEAGDGQDALDLVRRERPDVVLLDLQMPRLDGFEVCRVLKGDPATRLIPIVIITDLRDFTSKIRAVDLGADDFLSKPFNSMELRTRVRSLVALKRFTDELDHAARVMESLALAVENRDRYTGSHCRRIGEYGVRVGRLLALPEEDLDTLRLGGVFHDLGKISVSDMILNKAGRLTAEEFETMKAHPVTGFTLCQGMRSLERVLPLIRHHHEKLDGSGYPDGLKEDAIPLLVRITSVVDVYDALATKRSYKESLPREKCLAILQEEVGKGWWDSEVVAALGEVLAKSRP